VSVRTRIIIVSVLLVLALGSTVFAAASTVQAFYMFQQQHTLAKEGDVRTIRPWMTVPYISRIYHVPQSDLYSALHQAGLQPEQHTTLHALSLRCHCPVNSVIHTVQEAILTYRRQHPPAHPGTPTPAPTPTGQVKQRGSPGRGSHD
jgi:hypothetical protein